MPIFHDPSDTPPQRQVVRLSASESQRAWKPESSHASTLPANATMQPDVDAQLMSTVEAANYERRRSAFDRMYLIEQLKRENSPSWQLHQSVSVQT